MKLTDIVDEEYKTIDSHTIKKNSVEDNPIIFEKLRKEYESFLLHAQKARIDELEREEHVQRFLPQLFAKYPWTSKDITELSLVLKDYEHHEEFKYSGYFLSYLINHSHLLNPKEKYLIVTKHLETKINALCYKNKSSVTIDGDSGNYLCWQMICGTVIVNGNAEEYACEKMKNGTVTITGNTTYGAGYHLKGGKLIIKGNANFDVGLRAEGGKILVNGNVGDECGYDFRNGMIHVKGNCGKDLGKRMRSGTIRVDGSTKKSVGNFMEGGTIYLLQDEKEIQLGTPFGNKGKIYSRKKQIFPKER